MKIEKCDYEEIPCVNCITLPICLQIFKTLTEHNKNSMIFIRVLKDKCDVMYSYLINSKGEDGVGFNFQTILKVHDYLHSMLDGRKDNESK